MKQNYIPLGNEEKSIWIEWLKHSEEHTINTHITYELQGNLDIQRLINATKAVIKDNDLFRKSIVIKDGKPFFIYNELTEEAIEEMVIYKDIDDGNKDEFQASLASIIKQPIDPRDFPNFKIHFFKSKNLSKYYFLALASHILMDAHSCEILLRSIGNYYNHNITRGLILEPSDQVKSCDTEETTQYWKNKLSNQELYLNFSNQPNISEKGFYCEYCYFNKININNLRTIAKHLKTTEHWVLMALFAFLLHRYSGQNKFSILYTVNTRSIEEIGELGFHVNMLPMLIDINPNQTIKDLIENITLQRKNDKKFQHYHFNDILNEIRKNRQNKNNVFNIVYSRTKFYSTTFKLKDIDIKYIPIKSAHGQNDLTLIYDYNQDEMLCELEYAIDKFDQWFINQFIQHIKYLLNNLEAIIDNKIQKCDFLNREERLLINKFSTQLYIKVNSTAIENRLDKIFSLYGNKISIQDEEKNVTYAELNKLIRQFYEKLINIGIKPRDRIILLIERNRYSIAIILALIKLRCTYIPIETDFPAERIHFILNDCNANFIIKSNVCKIELQNIPIINLANLMEPQTSTKQLINFHANVDDVMYIIYTSGTTGKPKGVPTKYSSIERLFSSTDTLFNFKESDIWSLSHSFAFDFSVWEMLGALLNGSKCVIVPRKIVQNPEVFYRYICDNNITVFNQTPSSFYQFINYDENSTKKNSFRYIIFGGEKLEFIKLLPWHQNRGKEIKLINMYGLTEAPIHATFYEIQEKDLQQKQSIIGVPLPGVMAIVLDKYLNYAPVGNWGELYLTSTMLTSGYLNLQQLNQERFIKFEDSGETYYKTGDYVKWSPEGHLIYDRRKDDQIQFNGYRIELNEINLALQKISYINNAVTVVFQRHEEAPKLLISFCVTSDHHNHSINNIQSYLSKLLPHYMLPSRIIFIDKIPLTSQGKLDNQKLTLMAFEHDPDITNTEKSLINTISIIWSEILDIKSVGLDTNFFDVGGDSFLLIKLHERLQSLIKVPIKLNDLFKYTTIRTQENCILNLLGEKNKEDKNFNFKINNEIKDKDKEIRNNKIAVIGIALRFPEADSIDEFWDILKSGKNAITFFPLLNENNNRTNYVPAKGVVKNAEFFDYDFFGMSLKEAEITDPQHRLMLECAWTALEDSGYFPNKNINKIGIFGGKSSINSYLQNNLLINKKSRTLSNDYQLFIKNAPDFLMSTVAYKLGLQGPVYNLQTGCSTSLVAVCDACDQLKQNKCDLALAGGVALTMPLTSGYFYQDDMILSSDGFCRPFDTKATGTVPGNGIGMVVLKRLEDAILDHDHIYAVIDGYAINNDGSNKIGFTSPSQTGQAEVIKEALLSAGCSSTDIDYIETHGTGTKLGDSIEFSALQDSYIGRDTNDPYLLGSVKANIGHLDIASGIAGFIKTVLCLNNKAIVPSINFSQWNPNIEDHENFKMVDAYQFWKSKKKIRRAAVSSFGIGGTNAHVILSENIQSLSEEPLSNYKYLLPISAKTKSSLIQYIQEVALFLQKNPSLSLLNIAYTLQRGREAFDYRYCFHVNNINELLKAIKKLDKEPHFINKILKTVVVISNVNPEKITELYQSYSSEAIFNKYFDECINCIVDIGYTDLTSFFKITDKSNVPNQFELKLTEFVLLYALAKFIIELNIQPVKLIGVGIGKFVTSCIGGYLSLKETIELLADVYESFLNSANESCPIYSKDHDNNLKIETKIFNKNSIYDIAQCTSENFLIKNDENFDALLMFLENILHDNKQAIVVIGDSVNSLKLNLKPNNLFLFNSLSYKIFSSTLGELWSNGYFIDWLKLSSYDKGHRISLPTYSFQRKKCWIEPKLDNVTILPTNDCPKLFHIDWKKFPLLSDNESINCTKKTLLVFLDKSDFSEKILINFKIWNVNFIPIYHGDKVKITSKKCVINLFDNAPFNALLKFITKKNIEIDILFYWNFFNKIEKDSKFSFYESYLHFINLCKSIQKNKKSILLLLITSGLFGITSKDNIDPLQSLLLGPILTLNNEIDFIKCKIIDIDQTSKSQSSSNIISSILKEVCSFDNNNVIAYRHNQRLVRYFIEEKINLDISYLSPKKGVYIITGGLGHIASVFIDYFMRFPSVTLCLLHRTDFLPKESWESWLSSNPKDSDLRKKILQLKKAEELGLRIDLFQVDVSNLQSLNDVICLVKNKYHSINGVIHTAGISGSKKTEDITSNDLETVFAAKVRGTNNLHELLINENLDFFIICSALSAVRGDYGQTLYNSANAYLDAFANWRNNIYGSTLAINWDVWLDGGMAQELLTRLASFNINIQGLKDQEVVPFIPYLLQSCSSQLVITKSQNILENYINLNTKNNYENSNLTKPIEISEDNTLLVIKEVWRNSLGQTQIDDDTDYFSAGGDSLMALDLLDELSKKTGLQLTSKDILENPTPIKLAKQCLNKKSLKNNDHNIIKLSLSHDKNPINLFLIHPIGGTVYIYRDLVKNLGNNFCVYGLQMPLNYKSITKIYSVEAIAEYYVKEIQNIQHNGPYYLGGFSFGGTVAYEMAQQLFRKGHHVASLVMIDTPSGVTLPNLIPNDVDILVYLLEVGNNHKVPQNFYDFSYEEKLEYFLKNLNNLKEFIAQTTVSQVKVYLEMFKANLKAMSDYTPVYYLQNTLIHFLKAKECDKVNPVNPETGWLNLASSNISVHSINGNHLTMLLPPNVNEISLYINYKLKNNKKAYYDNIQQIE